MELDESLYQDVVTVKIVFLGDRGVGKTSIIRRYVSDQFDNHQKTTIGIDYMFKTVAYKGTKYKIQLWDTAGQQKYRSLIKTYLKNADCCIYVHDVNDLATYHHIVQWMNTMQEANNKDILQIIAGNKSDLKQQGFQKQESNFKLLYNKQSRRLGKHPHVQVSAKQRTNIGELFQLVLSKLVERRYQQEKKRSKEAVIRIDDLVVKKSCCGFM